MHADRSPSSLHHGFIPNGGEMFHRCQRAAIYGSTELLALAIATAPSIHNES